MNIKKGSTIIHKSFGKGIIISVGEAVEVQFDSGEVKKLLPEWVGKNCLVTDDVITNAEKTGGDNTDEMIIEYKIQNVMKTFQEFSLSKYGRDEIERFFRYKVNYSKGHSRKLRNNLLIKCDNKEVGRKFLYTLKKGMDMLDLLADDAKIIKEEEMPNTIKGISSLNWSFFGVSDGNTLIKDSVSIVSTSIRANLQLKKQEKDNSWKLLQELGQITPDCTIVAVGSEGFINYMQENEDMFYRFFSHRIHIQPMTVDEVIQATQLGIKEEGLIPNDAFSIEIEKYIKTVYPKADLKDNAFIDDLLNRILVSYYTNPTDRQLNETNVPFYHKPKSYEYITKQLNQLIGLSSVKKEFKTLYNLSKDEKSNNKSRLHFAFVGNPGTGKTTVAKITADLLFSMGLIKKNKVVTISQTDVISVYAGESAQLMREKIEEAKGGILFIDEAYFLTSNDSTSKSPEAQCLNVLIQYMENDSDNLSVIFAGYEKEINSMIKSNPGLASRVPFRFHFDDFTSEELLQIFLDLAARDEIVLSKEALQILPDRIDLAKTEESFGNARTIANLYQQVKAIYLQKGRTERVINADDIRETMPVLINADLDEMIGLEKLKKELVDFETRIKYIKFLKDRNMDIPSSSMHMVFVGNPGTGKTVVANKIADCLYRIGILKSNKLTVAERKDLVGKYIGETAGKTNEVIQKAMNGVLFIDEAYSLFKEDDNQDFGVEAISTLITAMEDYKNQLVVIFAGYEKEMKKFVKSNPGILSRIGFSFFFPDYTPEELTKMYYKKMKKIGFSVDYDAMTKVQEIMQYFSKMEDFGNGRFVNKVIYKTINNRAKRAYSKSYSDIIEEDIPNIQDLIDISINQNSLWTNEEQSDELRKRIAIHEAGHAVVSMFLCPEQRIKEITINADAESMGKTIYKTESSIITETYLTNRLAVLFGGRNAERLLIGDSSAGCENDIQAARKIATDMLQKYAMGELGVTTEDVLLYQADKTAASVLKTNIKFLSDLAESLFNKISITEEEIYLESD